jgi:hypothetical protein
MKKILALTVSVFTLFSAMSAGAWLIYDPPVESYCPGLRLTKFVFTPDSPSASSTVYLVGSYQAVLGCYKRSIAIANATIKKDDYPEEEYFSPPAHISFLKYDMPDADKEIEYISQVTKLPKKELFFTSFPR